LELGSILDLRNVLGKWSHSILEVHEIKHHVGENGELRVVLSLLDHDVVLVIKLVHGVVLEQLHKTDLVSVGEVVQVFEEMVFFVVTLIVILELLNTLGNHVLSEWPGFLLSDVSEFGAVVEQLSDRVISSIRGQEIIE